MADVKLTQILFSGRFEASNVDDLSCCNVALVGAGADAVRTGRGDSLCGLCGHD